ncbi:DUF2919 domain-containing protein [Shewanella sp. OPT22]|nr:DUF2919 domain-containing protein [Shewanella sp. OPT22]
MLDFSRINWLDDKGRVKTPKFLYLVLVFLAKGWCVFLMSLTQAGQRDGLVKLFYPLKSDFVSALATGAIAVFIYGLIVFERKGTLAWIYPLFHKIRWLLFASIFMEVVLIYFRLLHTDFVFHWVKGLEVLGVFWCFLYVFKSQHLGVYLKNQYEPKEESGAS